MSTVLVVSAVMLVAVVLVMGTALSDSDQPATIRLRTRRAGRETRARRRDRGGDRRGLRTQKAAPAKAAVAVAVPTEPAAAMDQAPTVVSPRPAASAAVPAPAPAPAPPKPEPPRRVEPPPRVEVEATAESPAIAEVPPVTTAPARALTDAPAAWPDGTTLVETPDVDRPSRGGEPLTVPPGAGASRRVRSGFALLLMIAFLGTLVAMAVGTAVALIAQALKHAVS